MKCPKTTCRENERLCVNTPAAPAPPVCPPPGYVAPTPGCAEETCIPRTIKNAMNTHDCTNHCPKMCGPNEVACTNEKAGFDQFGCPNPPSCLPIPVCGPHPECPRSEYNGSGCPVDPLCTSSQTLCPGPPSTSTAVQACPPKGQCMDNLSSMHKDKYGNACNAHCPVYCTTEQKQCPGQFDSDACLGAPTCVAVTAECPAAMYNSRGCLIHMPPTEVPEGQKVCASGADEMGCHLGFFLNPATDPCPEPKLPSSV